jgi:hypothetical protein
MVGRPDGDTLVVTVRGSAGPAVRAAFEDLEVVVAEETTELRSPGNDQAALHGILRRVQDLGLEIVEVRQVHGAGR